MKKYAVFVKYKNQPEGDYNIWNYLNSTNSIDEVAHWYLVAKEKKEYIDVIIMSPMIMSIKIEGV